jgi:hypothetical protein
MAVRRKKPSIFPERPIVPLFPDGGNLRGEVVVDGTAVIKKIGR